LPVYPRVGENITFDYSGGTGDIKDWIGIYASNEVPGTNQSLAFEYVPTAEGSITFVAPGLAAGDYKAFFLCCDGYSALASVEFTVFENIPASLTPIGSFQSDQPVRFNFSGGTGSLTDWVGIYLTGEVPGGGTNSQTYLYSNAVNGEVSFSPANFQAGVAYDAHFLCCDGYNILASYTNFMVATVGINAVNLPKINVFSTHPSPAHEFVNLKFDTPVFGQFTLLNINGQIVQRLAVHGESKLEVRNLVAGTYFGQFLSDKGVQTKKIVVE
jgi:hypothetical protein